MAIWRSGIEMSQDAGCELSQPWAVWLHFGPQTSASMGIHIQSRHRRDALAGALQCFTTLHGDQLWSAMVGVVPLTTLFGPRLIVEFVKVLGALRHAHTLYQDVHDNAVNRIL